MTATESPDAGDAAKVSAIAAAALGATFTVAAFALMGMRAGASVAVGSAIAVANLVTLRALIRAMLQPPDEVPSDSVSPRSAETAEVDEAGDADVADTEDDARAKARVTQAEHRAKGRRGGTAWAIFAVLKIFVLFGGVWLLLAKHLVDPIHLVVGYGVLPLGMVASTLIAGMRPGR